jgi:hypothetical protein
LQNLVTLDHRSSDFFFADLEKSESESESKAEAESRANDPLRPVTIFASQPSRKSRQSTSPEHTGEAYLLRGAAVLSILANSAKRASFLILATGSPKPARGFGSLSPDYPRTATHRDI